MPAGLQTSRSRATRTLLVSLLLSAPSSAIAGLHEDFVSKYAELNEGNWSHDQYSFPDATDYVNTFNRSIGITIPVGLKYPVNADFATQMILRYGSNFWDWRLVNGVVTARPRESMFGAGIGWHLGFGRIVAPASNPYGLWVYERADGKFIRFYESFAGEPPTPGVFYNHETPRLRLKVLNGGTVIKLEFPDGTANDFVQQQGSWEISKRYDQFGNYQLFSYRLDLNRVTTSDNHGRVQWIHFRADPSGYFPRVIDKVRVTRPGGSVAVYTFNYGTMTVATPAEDTDPTTPATVSVPILIGIDGPLGDVFRTFAYGSAGPAQGRLITQVDGEFGGQLRYSYADVNMPFVQNPANLAESMDHFAADVVGISAREMIDVDGQLLGTWSFSTGLIDGVRTAPPSLNQPTGLQVRINRPDGFSEYRYFRIAIQSTSGPSPQVPQFKTAYGALGRGHGYTFQTTKGILDPTTPGWLENDVVKVSYRCPTCLDPDPQIDYAYQAGSAVLRVDHTFLNRNWAGEASTFVETDAAGTAPPRETTVVLDTARPAVSALWINRTWSSKTVKAGSQTKTVEQCVDGLGRLTRKREVRASAKAANDFVKLYLYDAAGNSTETQYFGGDSQGIGTGAICALPLSSPAFREYRKYQFGSVSESGFLKTYGAIAARLSSATIDRWTGLPVYQADASDFGHAYTYDAGGRITAIIPAQGARTTFSYESASASPRAAVTTTTTDQTGGTVLSQRITRFDGFGRLIEKSDRGPAGWATFISSYDALGRVTTAIASDGGTTQYLGRDYRGRPVTVRPPEGSQHDTTYQYSANTVVMRKWIAKDLSTSPPAEQYRDVSTTKDRYGRAIRQVMSDQDGAVRTRTTAYNISGIWLSKSENGVTRSNLEQYDLTGLLLTNSYGSALTYNAMRQPLREYSRYGDRIDLNYDGAGRLISKTHNGHTFVTLEYAVANNPTEYNKNRLTKATRFNRNVPDVAGGLVIVEDNFIYDGTGGRPGIRFTLIKANDGSQLAHFSSQVTYTDDGQAETFYSSECSGSATFSCNQTSKTYEYGYAYGLLTNVKQTDSYGSSEYWLSNIVYDSQQRATSYTLGNGLVTQLAYDLVAHEPASVSVRNGATVLWAFNSAYTDGSGTTTHHGNELDVPQDFYGHAQLREQSTTYLSKSTNAENRQDPLGAVTMNTGVGNCPGAYSPCSNITIFNYRDKPVWHRNRPLNWPPSPVGMVTPSVLNFYDVFERRHSWNEGSSSYFNDRQNNTISLTYSTHSEMGRHDLIFGSNTEVVGKDQAAGIQRLKTYKHHDLSGHFDYGVSDKNRMFHSNN